MQAEPPVLAELPTLDAHAHIDARRYPDGAPGCGAVLAQTISLDEAERSRPRRDDLVTWAVGCHPRLGPAQAGFDIGRCRSLVEGSPVVGEVGLDAGSRVPWDTQLATFRAVVAVVAELPRIVSIHSFRATGAVLTELQRTPVVAPILHWWTGSADETSRAVELGCCFSVHSAVARRSTWHTRVPLDRILVESDHGWRDPPAAIPLRIGWVEQLVAQQYGLTAEQLRRVVWTNFARLVAATGTLDLLAPGIAAILRVVAG